GTASETAALNSASGVEWRLSAWARARMARSRRRRPRLRRKLYRTRGRLARSAGPERSTTAARTRQEWTLTTGRTASPKDFPPPIRPRRRCDDESLSALLVSHTLSLCLRGERARETRRVSICHNYISCLLAFTFHLCVM
ncbi:hypothetical protein PMAYCL1PPCAC_32243, partial [Pristionchus mayeri]